MDIFPYGQIERLIEEYEQDEKSIKPNRLVMENYPKVLIMYVASTFERDIKSKIDQYCNVALAASRLPIGITQIMNSGRHNPLSDKLFAKLKGYVDNNGIEILDANEFFQLFTGENFETRARSTFSSLHTRQISEITSIADGLNSLPETDDSIVERFIKYDDIRRIWNNCTFDISRDAYLGLKLRRNKVAHNYIGGLSDTFSNIRDFYYSGLLFVMTLVNTLDSMT